MCACSHLHMRQLLPSSVQLRSNQRNMLRRQSAHSPVAVSLTLMLIAAGCCSTYSPRATHLSAGNQLALCTLYLARLPPLCFAVHALCAPCGTIGRDGIPYCCITYKQLTPAAWFLSGEVEVTECILTLQFDISFSLLMTIFIAFCYIFHILVMRFPSSVCWSLRCFVFIYFFLCLPDTLRLREEWLSFFLSFFLSLDQKEGLPCCTLNGGLLYFRPLFSLFLCIDYILCSQVPLCQVH